MNQACHDVEALTRAYADAVLAKDPGRLAALYGAEVRVFDAWDRWTYDDLTQWHATLNEWLGSLGAESVQVGFADVRAFTRGDMGFFSAIVTYAAGDPAGKTLRSMQNRLTWVLSRTGDGWAIVHEHTSAPIRGSDQKAMLQRDV